MRPCRKSSNGLNRYETSYTRRAVIGRWKQRQGCVMCGNKQLASYQLDLNHIEPEHKCFGLSSNGDLRRSWNKIKNELSKCEVLCKNCHAIVTYNEKHYKLKQ